jgi:hypothetical protein
MTELSTRFTCDACGKAHRWKSALAGRRVKCSCGHVMTAPAVPPAEEEELYDLVPDTEPKPALKVTVIEHPLEPPAPFNPGDAIAYARRETPHADLVVDRYFPDRVKDLYLPLVLIAGGTVIEVAIAVFGRSMPLYKAGAAVGLYMLIHAAIMFVTALFAAKVLSISFGPIPTAIIKLCGIAIGPGAIGSLLGVMLGFIPIVGALIGWLCGCILYFATIGALFDLDEGDTFYVVIFIFFAKILVGWIILGML